MFEMKINTILEMAKWHLLNFGCSPADLKSTKEILKEKIENENRATDHTARGHTLRRYSWMIERY